MRIKDVAREAGVSTATVSHVINNTRFVSEEVRARVLEAIERCDYYPNAQARSLASGRSHTLGLLVSDLVNPFFPELVKSIETAAFERGYDVVLANTNYEAERTSNYVRRIIERKVAGVALMTSELDTALIDELARRDVCVVFLDLGSAGPHMSNLVVNYAVGIKEAIQHLVSLGHRKLAYISGPVRLRSAAKRREAFKACVTHMLPGTSPAIYDGDFKIEGGRRAASEMLRRGRLPSAVMAANDMMALGAMQEFRAAGLRIPHDISIVGFDDIAFASLTDPPLTTICLPRMELGRRAVEALMTTIEHPDRQGVEIQIPTYLIIRGSTAPASAAHDGISKGQATKRKKPAAKAGKVKKDKKRAGAN
ncbi:MAG TPA: LacI family DNA-binding transcriptional regulator [Pyrinomonadaceae bacterium]|nr:LacI family DNA-binding transcriptional regulator [Pyrinomonadaceae bacterium]